MKKFEDFIQSQYGDLEKHLSNIKLTDHENELILKDLEERFSTSWLGFSKFTADESTIDWPLPGNLQNQKRVVIMTIRGACIGSGLFTEEFRVIL